VQELRGTHERLKAEVAALDARRPPLEAGVAKLRETNHGLDVELSRFKLEYGLLETQRGTLATVGSILADEASELGIGRYQLDSVPATLAVQVKVLTQRADTLDRLNRRLQALDAETRTCEPPTAVPASGVWEVAPMAPVPAAIQPPDPDVPIPPDPDSTDALRKRIDALARELAAMLEARARLQDEAAWLVQANRLMDLQRDALQQELTRLEAVHLTLQQRQQALRAAVAQAERRRGDLLAEIARQDKENQRLLVDVVDLRRKVSQLQSDVAQVSSSIRTQNNRIEQLQGNNEQLTGLMWTALNPLLAGAARPGQAKDLAAMLAVKAYRWVPHDPDDAVQPTVYNALWRALRNIDAPAAMALLSPDGAATGAKLGTTSSALLVQALCQRVDRPFTEAEWRTYLPALACYTHDVARACLR
jgi:hypothetical protein